MANKPKYTDKKSGGQKAKANDYLYMDSNPFDYGSFGMMLDNPMGFITSMLASSEQRNVNAGIEQKDEYYGVPSKGIEFKYNKLDFDGNFYKGRANDLDHVFDKDGKFLFSAFSYDYIGQNIFIAYPEEQRGKTIYGSLYKDGVKMSDDLFRSQMSTKFKDDSLFCIIGYDENGMSECVINSDCEIVFEKDKEKYEHLYLEGNVLSCGKKYYNLFTGELICGSYYYNSGSNINTDDFLFVKSEKNLVCKIDKTTCEFETFGKPEIKPVVNTSPPSSNNFTEEEKILQNVLKMGRNDICPCGKNKKYKNCCGKGKC